MHDPSPNSSGKSTPNMPSNSSYLPAAMSSAVSGLMRRWSSNTEQLQSSKYQSSLSTTTMPGAIYTPPNRTASPFQPPPLYPVSLKGYSAGTAQSAQLLSSALAEEIRLLVPPRLQLCEDWNLVYSLDQDGVSLGTLYKKCDEYRGLRNGYVLVVKDGEGGLFGAYLTEPPHPSPHYFGTGECFLWRASILLDLPPPPSADTTHATRSTTLSSKNPRSPTTPTTPSTPDRIRFKAFPYSGENDYLMLCETGFFSVGGGDGHYGLWLDDTLERGISSSCPTFGNEPLSEEGEKFDILGVELWTVGNPA